MFRFFFVFSILLIFFTNIAIVNLYYNPIYIGWIVNATYLLGIFLFLPNVYKIGKRAEWLYIIAMIFGLIFHFFLNDEKKYLISDSIKWIFLVILIINARKFRVPRFVFYILVFFLLAQCILAIIEFRTQTNLFEEYSYFDNLNHKEFRSYAFMLHPLSSANITIIILSFMMLSKDINWKLKMPLLILGSLAMLAYNSRTALILWLCLLVYRYLLYNVKPISIIIIGLIVYMLFLNDFISFIQQNSNIFGRLAEKQGLVDESSMTRLLSYIYFWNARWNFQDIVFGGRVIYLPGTELSLENGILLTISWWGWIVGVLKVILELIISYMCLNKYSLKEKVILMIACWGTAFSNNNSVNTFVFAFFIISFFSINSLDEMQILNNKLNIKNIK
jgi:hypothetical protein